MVMLIIPGLASAMHISDGANDYKIITSKHNTYLILPGKNTVELVINGFAKLNLPTFSQIETERVRITNISITPELTDGSEVDEISITLDGESKEKSAEYHETITINEDEIKDNITLTNNAAYELRFVLWKIIGGYNQNQFYVYSELNKTLDGVTSVNSKDGYLQISESGFGTGGYALNLTIGTAPDIYLLQQFTQVSEKPLEALGKTIRLGYGGSELTKVLAAGKTITLNFKINPGFMQSDETKSFYSGPAELAPFAATNINQLMGHVDVKTPDELQTLLDVVSSSKDKINVILTFSKPKNVNQYLQNSPKKVIELGDTTLNKAAFIKAMLRKNKIPVKTVIFKDNTNKLSLLLKIWDSEEWIYYDILRKEIVSPLAENVIYEETTPYIQTGRPIDFMGFVIIGLLFLVIFASVFTVFKFRKFKLAQILKSTRKPKFKAERDYAKYKLNQDAITLAKNKKIPLLPDETDLLDYLLLTGGELNLYRAAEHLEYSIELIRSIADRLIEKGLIEAVE